MAEQAAQGDCIMWDGRLDRYGYGRRGERLAHRIVYEEQVGAIPPGLTLDHLCRNNACVNPEHLEPVTRGENSRRRNQAHTQCRNGHEYTDENTGWTVNGKGYMCRSCRECNRMAVARYAARKRVDKEEPDAT